MKLNEIRKNCVPKATEQNFADMLGISVSAYCNKEKGRRKFNANETVLLIKYATEHGIDSSLIEISSEGPKEETTVIE